MTKSLPKIGDRFILQACPVAPIGGVLAGKKVEVVGILGKNVVCVLLQPIKGLVQPLAQDLNLPKGQIVVLVGNLKKLGP